MLKLGSETGSLSNHLLSRAVKGEPKPVVGMGCTFLSWSDRHAGTIVEVVEVKGVVKRIACREDNAKRVDSNGMSESQDYVFSPNPSAPLQWFGKDRKGFWVRVAMNDAGRWVQRRSGGLRIGERDAYHDFSF